jgi:hypothetical protein
MCYNSKCQEEEAPSWSTLATIAPSKLKEVGVKEWKKVSKTS